MKLRVFWYQIEAESVLLTMISITHFIQNIICSLFCGSASKYVQVRKESHTARNCLPNQRNKLVGTITLLMFDSKIAVKGRFPPFNCHGMHHILP